MFTGIEEFVITVSAKTEPAACDLERWRKMAIAQIAPYWGHLSSMKVVVEEG